MQLTAVKRQMLVLASFHQALREGVIHSLTVNAFTPDEWAVQEKSNPPIEMVTLTVS